MGTPSTAVYPQKNKSPGSWILKKAARISKNENEQSKESAVCNKRISLVSYFKQLGTKSQGDIKPHTRTLFINRERLNWGLVIVEYRSGYRTISWEDSLHRIPTNWIIEAEKGIMEMCFPAQEWETHGNQNWMCGVLNTSAQRDGHRCETYCLAAIRRFNLDGSTIPMV